MASIPDINGLQDGFQSTNAGLSALASVVLQLNSSIADLQEALSNLSSMCMGDSTCLSLVPPMPQTELDFNENVRLSIV